jgi:hypothetical protein
MAEIHFKYQLANTAGYKMEICQIGHNVYDPMAYYHKENFPDVKITRPNIDTDMSLLHNKCLITVNGYVHPTSYLGDTLYVPNATRSMLRSKSNHIGILSFNRLNANLKKFPIDMTMITPESPFTLYEKVILTFPEDIQSPILILNGYLLFENPETFYRVSPRSFALRLDRLNYVERLYELSHYRDIFTEIDVPVSPVNPGMIDANIVKSDATILKFLTTFNTFLVDVPVNNLRTRRVYLEHSSVPGTFRTELEPNMPLMVGYGKLTEYMKKKTTDTKYTVYVNDAYYMNYLIVNTSFTNVNIYNNHAIPGNTYFLSQGYFLDIWTEV